MNNCYPLIKEASARVSTAIAAQDGNYAFTNPHTKKRVSIEEMYKFSRDYLKASCIFWCTEEPYYSKQVIPYLRKLGND